jgi:hypothetical protein
LLDQKLHGYYSDYYANQENPKRELTARQTIEHVLAVSPKEKANKLLDAEQLYAVEISDSGIKAIQAKQIPSLVEVTSFDGYKIPYPDDFFDVLTCIHVLEHVEHERLFLNELKRVSRSLIVEIPLEHTNRIEKLITIGSKYGHLNFYTPETFRNLLVTCDLVVDDLQVFANSQALCIFMDGKLKGKVKHSIKSLALKCFPRFATKNMVYMCIARCHKKPL